jgi:hypothetical protein
MQERASYETVSTYSKRGVHDIRHRVVSHVVPRIPRYHNLVPAKVQPDVQGHKAQERREKPWTRQIPGSPPPLRVEGCAVLRSRQPKGIDGDAPHDSLVRVSSRIRSSWLSGSPVKEVGGKAMVFPSVPGYWLNGAATVTINAARDILRVDCPERCLRQTGRSEVRLWGSTCSGGGGGIGNAGAAIGHDFALTKGLSIALPVRCVHATAAAVRFCLSSACSSCHGFARTLQHRSALVDSSWTHAHPATATGRRQRTMSAILSADDLNDFISPGVACIKPIETLPAANPEDGAVRLSPACACRRRPGLTNARMRTKSPPKTKSPPHNRRRPPRCR